MMRRSGTTLMALCLMMTACAADATVQSSADGSVSETPSQLIELLTLAPYDGEMRLAQMVTMDRLFASADLDHDAACDAGNGTEFLELIQEATSDSNAIVPELFYEAPATFDELPAAFGFAHCDIDSYLTTTLPDFYVWADKDGGKVAEQAAKDPAWAEFVTVSTVDDLTVVDWGDAFDFERATPLRRSGEGGKLVIADHAVARIATSDALNRILDQATERLIDRPHVRSIVEQLEARGAHSIVLSDLPPISPALFEDQFPTGLDGIDDETLEQLLNSPGLEPWITMGYGSAVSDEYGDVAIVAFGHLTSTEAEANMDRFPLIVAHGQGWSSDAPWSDRLTLVDIETDGLLVIATLVGANDKHPFSTVNLAYLRGETLLALGAEPSE